MRPFSLVLAAGLLLSAAPATLAAPTPEQAAAVADAGRPAEDVARDANRKPAAMLEFIGLKPGDKIADIIPASGYFTRVFAKTVGPSGKVYAVVPKELVEKYQTPSIAGAAKLAEAYPNVVPLNQPAVAFNPPEKLDAVFIAQNYHDMHTPILNDMDVAAWNKAVFDALKPGGLYIVLDHQAEAGSGLRDVNTLHRIEGTALRAEVEAAGFEFAGESDAVRNPADDHKGNVFGPEIRGKTDQFVYKFRKPHAH